VRMMMKRGRRAVIGWKYVAPAKTASCIIRDGDARYDDVILSRICAFLETTSSVTWLLKHPSNDTSNDTPKPRLKSKHTPNQSKHHSIHPFLRYRCGYVQPRYRSFYLNSLNQLVERPSRQFNLICAVWSDHRLRRVWLSKQADKQGFFGHFAGCKVCIRKKANTLL
jgi:hypothetical protein